MEESGRENETEIRREREVEALGTNLSGETRQQRGGKSYESHLSERKEREWSKVEE